jgi:hypothetical protein
MDISIEKEKKEGHIIYHGSFVFQLVPNTALIFSPRFGYKPTSLLVYSARLNCVSLINYSLALRLFLSSISWV